MSRIALLILAASAASADTLILYPAKATLYGATARQRLAVTVVSADGVERDVTAEAQFTVRDPNVAALGDGAILHARANGDTRVQAKYKGLAAEAQAITEEAAGKFEISFVKDVVPLFTRAGCAGSNCHGSIRGKAGFKLSLFGYEPDIDYNAILKADGGRRVDLKNPDQSLILKKPTFQIPHGGGVRFNKDSIEYVAIRDWIAGGAKYDSVGSPRIVSLEVYPRERRLVGIGAEQRLVVTARYTDGSSEDVTGKVQFTSNNEAVASVSPAGFVKAEAQGETAIMIRTLGQAIISRVSVIKDPPLRDYPAIETRNFIDRLVVEKLRSENIIPSEVASDEVFARRIFLDVLGQIPSIAEASQFLNSHDPNKRQALVESLLKRPERAEFWAQYFADLFRLGFNESRDKGAKIFYNWLRDAIEEDRPYNKIVGELLVGQGNLYYNPTSNFYFITRKLDPGDVATHISQSFLGVRIECAKCHNHPWEKWTQDDFYGFAAFFPRLATKFVNAGSESNVYLRDSGEVIHPKTKKHVEPRYLQGDLEKEGPDEDIRVKLAAWVTSPCNPFFARTIVNRIWKRYLGRGIVEPVDDFRITNPPSSEKLLDALAEDFIRNGFSLRHTERLILNSRTYQLSAKPNQTNRTDTINFSRYYPKRMMAEQLMDSIVQVTGVREPFTGWAPIQRAMAIPHGSPGDLLPIFGKVADREFIRERESDPNITQVLHMINGETLQRKLVSAEGNLVRWREELKGRDAELVDRVFLAILTRRPTAEERGAILSDFARSPLERESVTQDMAWALLNSKEFLYIH
jgi:hypothetical protein